MAMIVDSESESSAIQTNPDNKQVLFYETDLHPNSISIHVPAHVGGRVKPESQQRQ
jgi:hypothetical protein